MRHDIKSIQFLRFLAASLVVFSHSALAADLDLPKGSVSHAILYMANFGGVGVHIFFVISGFIMVYTSFAEGTTFRSSQFLLRRFCRIYPIYWIYVGVYIFVRQSVLQGYHLSPGEFVGSLLLLPHYSSLIIGPGWILSFEVYFYLCFGVFMMLGLKRGLLAMTSYFLISVIVGSIFRPSNDVLHVITDPLLIEFLLGAWIGFLITSGVHVNVRVANVLIALACLGFLVGLVCGYHLLSSLLMWGIPSVLLVAGLTFKERNGVLSSLIGGFSFLGDSSYSLYLLHILLIDICFSIYLAIFPDYSRAYIGICLAVTALCVVIALFSYEIIERPVVRTAQRLTKGLTGSKSLKGAA